jgi:hypothetical protein
LSKTSDRQQNAKREGTAVNVTKPNEREPFKSEKMMITFIIIPSQMKGKKRSEG